jgi:hypothetical protein
MALLEGTNEKQYATRSLLSRSRVDWAIEAARRVRAEPVGALGGGLVVEDGAARRRRGGWVEDLPNAASPISPVASASEVWAWLARPSEAARG